MHVVVPHPLLSHTYLAGDRALVVAYRAKRCTWLDSLNFLVALATEEQLNRPQWSAAQLVCGKSLHENE